MWLSIMFELILKTILRCIVKTKRETCKSPVTDNELMQTMTQQCIHNQLISKYILADYILANSWFTLTDNMHFIQSKKSSLFLTYKIIDWQSERIL